jgi:LysM repeat protein
MSDLPPGASAMLATPPPLSENRDFDPAPLPTFLTERSLRARPSSARQPTEPNVAPVSDAGVGGGAGGGGNSSTPARLLTMAAVVIILALGVATVLIVPGLLSGNAGPGGTARPSLVAGSLRPPTALASGIAVVPSASGDQATAPAATGTPVPAATPTPTPRTYKVQPGDSLRRIAREFGVTVADILAANPTIPDADHVEVGQKLVIPAAPQPT